MKIYTLTKATETAKSAHTVRMYSHTTSRYIGGYGEIRYPQIFYLNVVENMLYGTVEMFTGKHSRNRIR